MGDFDRAWHAYPKRAGGNSKQLAQKAFGARLRAGVSSAAIIAGVERYAAFIRSTGREGTEFVKQAATFFGPAEHWKETWTPPAQPTNARQAVQQRTDDAIRRAAHRYGGQPHA